MKKRKCEKCKKEFKVSKYNTNNHKYCGSWTKGTGCSGKSRSYVAYWKEKYYKLLKQKNLWKTMKK